MFPSHDRAQQEEAERRRREAQAREAELKRAQQEEAERRRREAQAREAELKRAQQEEAELKRAQQEEAELQRAQQEAERRRQGKQTGEQKQVGRLPPISGSTKQGQDLFTKPALVKREDADEDRRKSFIEGLKSLLRAAGAVKSESTDVKSAIRDLYNEHFINVETIQSIFAQSDNTGHTQITNITNPLRIGRQILGEALYKLPKGGKNEGTIGDLKLDQYGLPTNIDEKLSATGTMDRDWETILI